ncbi:psbP domain-containing protein 2, chloroplastic-like [Pistacia vera]|uniref:Uncharacterized protein n=1 Tax=Pistacia integerrima TaxID=434235 RepID=A0ACC0YRM4_9ROSI|nr:psbP domain-containing protein 2, chloroplastic-like [Pistacia vera]KAJ0040079.1 hypothetical protein Pint_27433 [Pistacia integerrima]
MASQICLVLSTHQNSSFSFIHNPIPKFPSSTKPPFLPQNYKKETLQVSLCLSKRELNLSLVTLLLNGFYADVSKAEEMELERYTDSTEGFTFLRPSSWIKVDKAGATVLFQEANKGSNNVGVVVNPVRLSSLGAFGTPQFVAEKLIQAEKRKCPYYVPAI